MALRADAQKVMQLELPAWFQALFQDPRLAILWLPIRLWLGWQWWESGSHKIIDPVWMNGGQAILGFWQRQVAIPEPPARPPIAFDWYRSFLQALIDGGHNVWFGPLIAVGETLVGVALILGGFTALAAFFGAVMNWNFIMAGTASTNGLLLVLAVLLILAWRTAGWWGLDRWILTWIAQGGERGLVPKSVLRENPSAEAGVIANPY